MEAFCAYAQEAFDVVFCDTTLRLDYIFSGDSQEQHIALQQVHRSPHWYGKRNRLAEAPMEGNGSIVMTSLSGDTLFVNTFSTLFQEWLTYDEAKERQRAFENVFLVPMPKEQVRITIELRNNRRQPVVSMSHLVSPDDILIRHFGEHDIMPYTTIQQSSCNEPGRYIPIAFVAEGYTEQEMPQYLDAVNRAVEALFAHEPFRSLRDRFTIHAVMSSSEDSGTSVPSKHEWKNTVLGSSFDTFYSDRYLTTLNLRQLHDVLAGVPYQHIIILVNSDTYGGGGILNSYNLTSVNHRWYLPVVVHEFGHSFAGLADEYAYEEEPLEMYPLDVEPWEQNITTMVDFKSKWWNMTRGTDSIGAPKEGAGYSLKGVFRPCSDCRMRTNSNPDFCPVCRRAIMRVVDFYTR